MRLWSIHPGYLDTKGLLALWREALLAQKVLAGKTFGYRNHPQLLRFINTPEPELAIAGYLQGVLAESIKRDYKFDKSKICCSDYPKWKIQVTKGQLDYEFRFLCHKLYRRDKKHYLQIYSAPHKNIKCHPIFNVIPGEVESWERLKIF